MADLMTKAQLADAAKTMAAGFSLIQRSATTFIPVDWETGEHEPVPAVGRRIWVPFTRDDKIAQANTMDVLFASDGEFRNFDFMLRQVAQQDSSYVNTILVKTAAGLKMLDEDGQLVDHDGSFCPNYIQPLLNENQYDKEFVFGVIKEWLGDDEDDAHSLLYHLATSLSPGYSAVKYILLLGEGRNGKSVLLSMLSGLYGQENISHISRQAMSVASPTCVELNDKLLNVIFDGEMTYIKDSSMEKSLIAGEPRHIRLLWESGTTRVQTNALFIEALNEEPKARDKTSALQKRLVRYRFPNTYKMDLEFSAKMTSDRYLGALLSLLIDHYVKPSELATKLKPTASALELQFEQTFLTAPVLQYLAHVMDSDPKFPEKLAQGQVSVEAFVNSYQPWADSQHLDKRSDAEVKALLKQSFDLKWKTRRVGPEKKPTNTHMIVGVKQDTQMAIDQMRGETIGTEHLTEEVVGD